MRAPHVERDRDDDAAKPSGKARGILEIAEAAERAEVGLLRGVLRERRVTQHTFRDGVGHRLRLLHEAGERVQVAGPGAHDEIVETIHVSSLATHSKDTDRARV